MELRRIVAPVQSPCGSIVRLMPNSIFSRYRQGENRVTATLLALLERLGPEATETLLSTAVEGGDETVHLVRFRNQPVGNKPGVPDGQIRASVNMLFETKVTPRSVNYQQLTRHLRGLDDGSEVQRLYVLTPDVSEPPALARLNDPRVRWMSFLGIHRAIEEFISEGGRVLGERDEFLLRQFQLFLQEEGLVGLSGEVLVVPARSAYEEYLEYSAYICQPGRSFRNVEYMAFYRRRQIEPEVARVTGVRDQVEFSDLFAAQLRKERSSFANELASLIERVLRDGIRQPGELFKVMLLSGPDDPATDHLSTPIRHLGRSAWVQGQRYVTLESLQQAETTDQL
jgi:hypothetical protein